MSSPPLIDWKTVESNLAWGIILLLGGGFALSEASEVSCLSAWIELKLAELSDLPSWVLLMILSLVACAVTQVLTNTASASLLLPVYRQLALELKLNPLYLMLAPTLVTSFAFMLPVSTGPNAIAFRASGLNVVQMAKAGSGVTVLCLLITLIAIHAYGTFMFDLDQFPEWAEEVSTENTSNICYELLHLSFYTEK